MATDAKRSSSPVDDSVLNNTAFSIDSLQIGDSTRSLLSPLYDKAHESERSVHSEPLSEKDSATDSHSDRSDSNSESDKSDDSYSSDYEESETTTVKNGKIKEAPVSKSSQSSGKSGSSSSYSTPKTKRAVDNADNVHSSKINTKHEPCNLSPWEKWLLAKVVDDEKRVKVEKRNKYIQIEIVQKEMKEKTEKEKRAEVNRKEWLRLKRNEEKIKSELAIRTENEKLNKREVEQSRIQAKAEESFDKWFEAKQHERNKQMKNIKLNEKVKKENESQRKQQSEEAYKLWLQNAKRHQKSQNNHFGYLGGKVTGYYDWTCYPMPSYNNPQPWVSPKVKMRYQSKIKLQNPSPPLLFKEIEDRERKAKQTSRNSIC